MPLYWAFYQKKYNLSALCKVVTNIVRTLQCLLEVTDNHFRILLFIFPAARQVCLPVFNARKCIFRESSSLGQLTSGQARLFTAALDFFYFGYQHILPPLVAFVTVFSIITVTFVSVKKKVYIRARKWYTS